MWLVDIVETIKEGLVQRLGQKLREEVIGIKGENEVNYIKI